MLRYFIVVKIMSLLAISLCQADEVYDQSVIVQVNQYLASNACVEKCTLQTQSSGIGMDVDLTRLLIDLNSDGEPDYILSSRDNCGASNCIEALLASNNKKLIKVFEGQGIAYFAQSTNNFRDLVRGKRGPGQPSYGGTGKIPVYRWNGERYIESGSIDDQTSSVTSIHTDLSTAPQKQDRMENSGQCNGKTFNVQKGETICGFLLDSKGMLHYKNKKVSDPIVNTYSSDGSQSLADSLIIYPSSPSGRYYYIKACEEGTTHLCWSQWLFDSNLNKFKSISIGEYGAYPEIYWNSNDRLAALFYSDEDQDQIHILDAETGKTWEFPDWSKQDSNSMAIDRKSFAWIDSSSFNIDAAICKESKLAPSDCSANISSALKKKTVFNIQGDKLYPLQSKTPTPTEAPDINQKGADPIIVSSEFDAFSAITRNSIDIYELYSKAGTIVEMLKYAKNLNTLDDLDRYLSHINLLGSSLSQADITKIRSMLEANLYAEAGSIFAHFLLNKQYDYWESQGINVVVPRNIAESTMDTLVNAASANLPGQIKDQTLAITKAYLDVRDQKNDYISNAIQSASIYVNALTGKEQNYRSLINGMIAINESYVEDVAKKTVWISDFDSEAKIKIINSAIRLRAYQISGINFGESNLDGIKALAKSFDDLKWGFGNTYQKFAEEVVKAFAAMAGTQVTVVTPGVIEGPTSATKVIGQYEYIANIGIGRKPHKIMGTITLSDVGLMLSGEPNQKAVPSTVFFLTLTI